MRHSRSQPPHPTPTGCSPSSEGCRSPTSLHLPDPTVGNIPAEWGQARSFPTEWVHTAHCRHPQPPLPHREPHRHCWDIPLSCSHRESVSIDRFHGDALCSSCPHTVGTELIQGSAALQKCPSPSKHDNPQLLQPALSSIPHLCPAVGRCLLQHPQP